MARVYGGEPVVLDRVLGPVERGAPPAARRRAAAAGRTGGPTRARCWSSAPRFWPLLYLILRTQSLHPWNPLGPQRRAPGTSPSTSPSSFVTNTNWQFYGGETTLTYFTQMAGLAVQNFVSAARRHGRRSSRSSAGSPPRSATSSATSASTSSRTLLYVPAADLDRRRAVPRLPGRRADAERHRAHDARRREQTLALGPVASQEAIKLLGTNGGGFFNVNSAMPFENPTWLTNFVADAR